MAAILLSACTVTNDPQNGYNCYKIVTPATADDGDTIDVSSILGVTDIVSASCYGVTDDWEPILVITLATGLLIPGATDNEARTIYIMGRV